jgi:hypothetical protein
MFLFYTLMCRNYQEYKWKPYWSQIGTFMKSVPELFSKMVTLRVEDGIKRKTLQLQSCREFHGKHSEHKIRLIPSSDGQVRPDLVWPKMGRQKSEKLYKGRKSNSWETPPPTNLQPPEPCFRLPHGSHLHRGGLPWNHEGRGPRGGAPPWCRRRGSPPRPSLLISAIFTVIFITNSSYYAVVHPPTHLYTVLCKYGVWCYNIYPMIYVIFA